MLKPKKIFEIYGFVGTGFILTAFFLSSYNFLETQSIIYQLMNIFGALGVASFAFIKRDFPSLILETIWALIAFTVLIKLLFF